MAEKRPLSALGPGLYPKLPRLAPGLGPSLRSNGPEPCLYKGACFSCPTEPASRLTAWAPCPVLCPPTVAGAPDSLLASCLLYQTPEGTTEPAEPLPFPTQLPPCPGPPLAAPKPVYLGPCTKPMCLGLSACPGERPAGQLLDTDWTLLGPPCALASRSGQCADSPSQRPGQDTARSFSPCQAYLSQCRPSLTAARHLGPYMGDPSRQVPPEGCPGPWAQLASQDAVPTRCLLPAPTQVVPEKPCYDRTHSLPFPRDCEDQSCLSLPAVPDPCPSPLVLDTHACCPRPELPGVPCCPPNPAPPVPSCLHAQDHLGGTPPPHSGLPPGPLPSALQGSPPLDPSGPLWPLPPWDGPRPPSVPVPPHSPPMPVIDTVFSLAPYRHYLDEGPPVPQPPSPAAALQEPDGRAPRQEQAQALDLSVRRPVASAPVQASTQDSVPPGSLTLWLEVPAPPSSTGRRFKALRPALPHLGRPAPLPHPGQPAGLSPAEALQRQFTGLHASLCDAVAGAVARAPPERLREWLAEAGPWGRAAWREALGVPTLLGHLLAQLQSFAGACPFPHVVRAGAVFVPIHLVKARLFPRLPPGAVERLLQERRVELRPTTLSEERALRVRALRGCPSRMLKLLALHQLRALYPDLLGLQWHDCVRRQLGYRDPEDRAKSGREPTLACREPESLTSVHPVPMAGTNKTGRKVPTPGPEKEVDTRAGVCCPSSAPPSSPPGPTLRARFRNLLETAWHNGLALPTWGHKTSTVDRARLLPGQLLPP